MWILDRVEDRELAVLMSSPEGRSLVIPLEWIAGPVREGDVIEVIRRPDGGIRLAPDPAATADRRRTLEELRESIPKAPSGNIDL
ncbi:hypothetical protein BH23GEM11_BH23GEM11_10110 [soil metagenome]